MLQRKHVSRGALSAGAPSKSRPSPRRGPQVNRPDGHVRKIHGPAPRGKALSCSRAESARPRHGNGHAQRSPGAGWPTNSPPENKPLQSAHAGSRGQAPRPGRLTHHGARKSLVAPPASCFDAIGPTHSSHRKSQPRLSQIRRSPCRAKIQHRPCDAALVRQPVRRKTPQRALMLKGRRAPVARLPAAHASPCRRPETQSPVKQFERPHRSQPGG